MTNDGGSTQASSWHSAVVLDRLTAAGKQRHVLRVAHQALGFVAKED